MNFIQQTLLELHTNFGYSQACVERTLSLPMGTLNKQNRESIALMRMIKAFPWLLKVADRQFDEVESKRILGHVAVDIAADIEKIKGGQYKPTDVLLKDYRVSADEIYEKGSFAFIPQPFSKCMNVVFVTKEGRIKQNKTGALSLFDSNHFKPKSKWFKKLKEKK